MDGKPNALAAGLKEIVRLLGEGDLKAAMDRCSLLLRADPQCAPALHMMGIVASRMGDQGLAISFAERAHQIEPDWREYPAMLAYLHATVGRISDALYYAKLATVLAPHPDTDLLMPADLPMGRDVFDNVDLSMHWLLAEAAFGSGRFAEAAQEAEAELRINPERYDTLVLLARARHAQGQHDVARAHLQAAIQLQPGAAPAIRWLGDVLLSLGEHDQAQASARAALDLETDDDAVAAMHALVQLAWQTDGNRAASVALAADLRDRANPGRRPAAVDESSGFIGLVWDQCHAGPLADFILPVLDHLDDTILYRLNRRTDATTEVLRTKVTRFQDCPDLDPMTFGRIVAGDAPRALINLCASVDEARFPQFTGSQPPPVAQWLTLPMLDRLPGADVVIGAPATRLADQATFGADAVVALPQLLAWRFPATGVDAETVAPLPRAAAGQVTFGAIGDLRRVTADTVALWAAVLRAVPDAAILIGNANGVWPQVIAERLGMMFANFGVVDRVRLQGPHAGGTVNLDFYARADVMLDTCPVNGMNDVAEALWMGVPVVTLRGTRRAGCTGAAILEAAGRAEWIAETVEDYVALAAGLADAGDLAQTRAGLRDATAASGLCDAENFARMLKAALFARQGRAADAA
jgi:predicted O-linked N-acetylglucosamine transferase (SPINDLY family)